MKGGASSRILDRFHRPDLPVPGEKPRTLVGVFERIGEKGKEAFTTREELWEILHAPPTDRQNDHTC